MPTRTTSLVKIKVRYFRHAGPFSPPRGEVPRSKFLEPSLKGKPRTARARNPFQHQLVRKHTKRPDPRLPIPTGPRTSSLCSSARSSQQRPANLPSPRNSQPVLLARREAPRSVTTLGSGSFSPELRGTARQWGTAARTPSSGHLLAPIHPIAGQA